MTAKDIRGEVRGVTLPIIWTFITGTALVCSTIIGGVLYVGRKFENHDVRIGNNEKKIDKLESFVYKSK